MQKTEKLEKRERIYYKGCTLLVLLFEFLTGISAVLSVVDFIRVVGDRKLSVLFSHKRL